MQGDILHDLSHQEIYIATFFVTIEIATAEDPMFILVLVSKVSWYLFWQLKYSKDHILDTMGAWKIVDMFFRLMKILLLYLYQTFLTMFWHQSLMITTSWWRHINDTWEFSRLNPCAAETGMPRYNYVNTVAANALVPCVTSSSVTMMFILQDN